ncbi:MAG TPA: hypothetical protein VFA69_05125 [Candidatus Nitrosotalea sp.]|nr:hypothetical protein [Candidatus Nitrosotalea sp.]
MKTLHRATIIGIVFVIMGTSLLAVRTYFDEFDKSIAEKSIYYLHCPYSVPCPLPPQGPYFELISPFTYAGIISCGIGVIVVTINIKQKIRKTMK